MRLHFLNLSRPKMAAKYIQSHLPDVSLSKIQEAVAAVCGFQNWYELLHGHTAQPPTVLDENLTSADFHHRLGVLIEKLSPELNVRFNTTLDLLAGSHLIGSRPVSERDREGISAVLSARHLAQRLELARRGQSPSAHSADAMELARKTIRSVLDRSPKLHATAWGTTSRMAGRVGRIWPAGAELVEQRESLFQDRYVAAFIECQAWLWRAIFRRQIPKDPHHSYNLKHEVERVHDLYVPNGAFIAAALDAGLQYRERFNPHFNLCRSNVLSDHRHYRRPDGSIIHARRLYGAEEYWKPSDIRWDPSRYDPQKEYALYDRVEYMPPRGLRAHLIERWKRKETGVTA